MPAGQQISLEHALAEMLGEDFDHPAVGAEMLVVGRQGLGHPPPARDVEEGIETVGCRLVGPEDPEVGRTCVGVHDIPEELAENAGGLADGDARGVDRHAIFPEVRQSQIPQQETAVGVGVGAHAAVAHGRQGRQLGPEGAGCGEQLLGPVAAQPVLQLAQMVRIGLDLGEGHLMGSPRSLGRLPVHLPGPSPTLRRSQHDHRPRGSGYRSPASGLPLDHGDLVQDFVERVGQGLMDQPGLIA